LVTIRQIYRTFYVKTYVCLIALGRIKSR